MTPGQRIAHAHFLRDGAADYRRKAAAPDVMAHWRRKWLDDADRMDEDAEWFAASTAHFTEMPIEPYQEAAE